MFYGFNVTAGGLGAQTYNVGTNGSAFGVANGTILSVLDILQATNDQSNSTGLYGGNSTRRNQANTIYQNILKAGDDD